MAANADPRQQHHIIPAFYLAGFTPEGTKTGKLQVFDYESGEHYESSPLKACRERDFYRVEEPGYDPNFMEKVLSWHEGVVAPFVQSIAANRRAEDRHQVGEVLAFAALLAVRDRKARERLKNAGCLAKKLRQGQVSEEQWKQLRASELLNGAAPEDVPPYAEAVEAVRRGDWMPRTPKVIQVGMIPEAQDSMMRLLHQREWELMVTDSTENGGFISSDNPVVWGDLDLMMEGHTGNLSDWDIEVTFPVSKDAALVSFPGARAGNITATDEVVARVNSRTLHTLDRQVFHLGPSFLLQRGGGQVVQSDSFFEYFHEARRLGVKRP